jgi:NADP+-dependent farnesol dehydrogenase
MNGLARWKGRVALVTGASSGIGAAVAQALAGAGLRVALTARRGERLEALAEQLRKEGAQVLAVSGDMAREADILHVFGAVRQAWGTLDVLVNNAGTATMQPFADGSAESWRQMLDVNVLGLSICTREALKAMEGKDDALIVNIASIYAHLSQAPNFACYQATKMAVVGMTRTLRAELKAKGSKVRLGMISPGLTATEFREHASGGKFSYDSYFKDFQPLLPEDIAQAALYMLSAAPHVQVNDIQLTPLGLGL